MEFLEQVHLFATKWIEKFRDQKISYIELVDHYFADDCQALGFQMDCGHAFSEKYGDAAAILNPENRSWFILALTCFPARIPSWSKESLERFGLFPIDLVMGLARNRTKKLNST